MTQIQFYHLTATPYERALPKLVEKAVERGYRVLLKVEDEEKASLINQLLWTYSQASFLPHGTLEDPEPEAQPVLIATELTDVNQPNLLFVTDGTAPDAPEAYERILDLFDGHDKDAVASARARWKRYKDSGAGMQYFSQTDSGGWEQKAA